MDGRTLVRALAAGATLPRPPFAPLVGALACVMGQVPADRFTGDPQMQAMVLAQVGAALCAHVITVGVLGGPAVGVETIPRLRAAQPDGAVAGWIAAGDVAGTRAYGEAGADLLFVAPNGNGGADRKLRTQANAAAFYRVPTILVPSCAAVPDSGALAGAPGATPGADIAAAAHALGLSGAVISGPTGDEPGIVGGILPAAGDVGGLVAPRSRSFFWTFAAPAGADADIDRLAALGRHLAATGS